MELLSALGAEVSGLIKEGKEVIIVSSGAIALGMSLLKLNSRPKELAKLQALDPKSTQCIEQKYSIERAKGTL